MSRTTRDLLILAGIFALLAALPFLGLPGWVLTYTARIMAFAICAVALDLVLGYGGLVSLGHAAFLGIGSYAAGILLAENVDDFFVGLGAGMAAAGLYALVTGAVAVRTKGVAFIMITLAFGQMAYFVANALSEYGGSDGLTLWSRASIGGRAALKDRTLYFVILAGLLLSVAIVRLVTASPFGAALRAARNNPERVTALGYDVDRVRLAAYVLSAVLCGGAGVLIANLTSFVSPALMAWQRSGEFIVMVILGGAGTPWGALAGAFAVLALEEGLSLATQHWKIVFGALLVLAVLFTRGGIAGLLDRSAK